MRLSTARDLSTDYAYALLQEGLFRQRKSVRVLK